MSDAAFHAMITNDTWNILFFYRDEMSECIEAMNVGLTPSTLPYPPHPNDRTRCHVVLLNTQNGKTSVDVPFLTHFTHPFEYAKHIVQLGFSGLLIKDDNPNAEGLANLFHDIFKQFFDKNITSAEFIKAFRESELGG